MSQQPMMPYGAQPQMQYAAMAGSPLAPQMPPQYQQTQQAAGGGQVQTNAQVGTMAGQQQMGGGAGGYQPQVLQQQIQYQHLQQQHQQQLQLFWQQQMQEVEQANDFKNHQLPLARIKKIMKADEDVRMISAEAPVVFSKACEMFILELTLRSWIHTEENKRRTLQKNDIAAAITRTDIFDFLVDIVPRDELKEEGLAVPRPQVAMGGAEIPYPGIFYAPAPAAPMQQPGMMAHQMMVGRPAMQMDPSALYQQPRPGMAPYMQQPMQQQMWTQQTMPPGSGSMPPGSG